MSLVTLKDIAVTLGTPLFSGLNFSIERQDRIGLVAANGRGKSTLLRCLGGQHEPTSGDITCTRGLRVCHVEQELPDNASGTLFRDFVLDALTPEQIDSESWRVDIVLDELEVPDEHRMKCLGALSG
ncbi:MAG: ATP-binding cassette domain-containing protein, partial [Rhizobiaceae bacterium]